MILFLGSFCPPSIGNLSRICICKEQHTETFLYEFKSERTIWQTFTNVLQLTEELNSVSLNFTERNSWAQYFKFPATPITTSEIISYIISKLGHILNSHSDKDKRCMVFFCLWWRGVNVSRFIHKAIVVLREEKC